MPRERLNRTRGSQLCHSFFLLFAGLRFPEALSDSTIAELTMQQQGKQKSYVEYPGGLYYEQYTCFTIPSRSLPLEGDMLNSPIPCLSHYLYRSAFIAVFFQ